MADDEVFTLTDENFNATINSDKPVLVKFFAPWCGHCKALAPEYIKLAEEVIKRNDSILIAEMDATVHKQTAEKYKVSSFPTIKFFIDGEPIDYTGERNAQALLKFVELQSLPPSTELKSVEEIKKKIDQKGRRCILVSDNEKDIKEYKNTARLLSQYTYFHASEELGKQVFPEITKPSVVILRDFAEPKLIYDKSFKSDEFLPFLKGHQYDTVAGFDQDMINEVFQKGHKAIAYIAGDAIPEGDEDVFKKVAKAREGGEFLFLTSKNNDEWGQRILDYLGLNVDELPVVEILDSRSGEPLRYRYEGKIEFDSLQDFIERCKKGKVRRYSKSQPIPAENPGPVFKVVGKNFIKEVIENDYDVLVKFYADWCGHCKKLAPIYEAVAKKLMINQKLKLVEIEAPKNDVEGVTINSYPTIFFFPAGKKNSPIKYDGERTEDGFIKFLKEKCTNPVTIGKTDL